MSTPIATNHHLSQTQTPCNQFEQEEYERYARGIRYISLVGSLLYATQTRPNIQFAVGLTAQFMGNPGIPHLSACKRILQYLKGTKNLLLRLGGLKKGGMTLIGWSDLS